MNAKLFFACTLSTALAGSQVTPPLLSTAIDAHPRQDPTPGTLHREVQQTMDYQRIKTPPEQGDDSWLRPDSVAMSPSSMVSVRSNAETNRVCGGAVKGCCAVFVMGLIGVIIWGAVKLAKGS